MNAVQLFVQSIPNQSSNAANLQKSNDQTPFVQVMNRELSTKNVNQENVIIDGEATRFIENAAEKGTMFVDQTNEDEILNFTFYPLDEIISNDEEAIIEEVNNIAEVEQKLLDDTVLYGFIIEIEQLLEAYKRGENQQDVLSRLYEILKKFNEIKVQLNDKNVSKTEQQLATLSSLLKEPYRSIWQEVAKVYEKRNKLVSQQVYQTEATITKADVARWLERAIMKYFSEQDLSSKATVTNVQTAHHQPLLMNEVQQYTIYVNNLTRVDAISEELVQKLANVVKQSNFIARPGMTELSITLKPENLGNIVVRFVQVNGEMTVNFIVSSQLTKEILESNLHQLKPMFAPHQITIERDTVIRESTLESDQNEEQHEDASEQHDEQNHEHHQPYENEDNKPAPFKEMLTLLSKEAFSG